MEESKAAAYFDELTRKGEGAAKFKQGLGFTDNAATAVPVKGSALPSSSSFLSTFVKSSTSNTESDIQHQSELHSIKNKLKKKAFTSDCNKTRVPDRGHNDSNVRVRGHNESNCRDRGHNESNWDRGRGKRSTRRSRSRSRERKSRYRSSSRDGNSSRSRSRERKSRYRYRSLSRDGERRRKSRSRSLSPTRERRERNGGGGERDKGSNKGAKEKNGGKVDYARLIDGYDKMSPAERVKAKIKLQLTETAEKDVTNGTGSGWERFEFNKDAPLDDEEIEAAEDDAKIVKHIGQSFRFSAVEARKEEEIKAAHDKAMFGAPKAQISVTIDDKVDEENNKTENEKTDATSLMSEKVLAKQQGSWRDRVRKT